MDRTGQDTGQDKEMPARPRPLDRVPTTTKSIRRVEHRGRVTISTRSAEAQMLQLIRKVLAR